MRKHNYFARGKVLLFGEYFVLYGSKALAIPTKFGQHLNVEVKRSFDPKLVWESYDVKGEKWFDVEMDLWHFESRKSLESAPQKTHETLRFLLEQVRRENPHFLREKEQIKVETKLEFPLEWGLGSSSSLIFNVAQWANVNPFDLGARSFGGSGYDIACAQAMGPIVYTRDEKPYAKKPEYSNVNFDPSFKENLYFVYLGQKESTGEHLKKIKKENIVIPQEVVSQIDCIIDRAMSSESLIDFEECILKYEELVETYFLIPRMKEQRFSDYWGEIKSMGAWGGDFVMVTSTKSEELTREYFLSKGYQTFMNYSELVCESYQNSADIFAHDLLEKKQNERAHI